MGSGAGSRSQSAFLPLPPGAPLARSAALAPPPPSLVNSFIIVIFLTFMVAMILIRSLHKDIDRYNQVETQEAQEDWGWKLVHGDVFRTPSRSLLLSVLTGNGAQLLGMSVVTLVLALFGFLSPASRGALMTVALVFYVLLGSLAGFASARLYKMFGGERWKTNVVLTAFLIPGCVSRADCGRARPPRRDARWLRTHRRD